MTGSELYELWWIARTEAWRARLTEYDEGAVRELLRIVNLARAEILEEFRARLIATEGAANRTQAVLEALDDLTLGLRAYARDGLLDVAGQVGADASDFHSGTMSVNGAASAVDFVRLSPEQMRAFLIDLPHQGLALPAWVDLAYAGTIRAEVEAGIRDALNVGVIRGEGYEKIVARLGRGFEDFARRELVTLARTYVQEANARAYDAVIEANRDMIAGNIWTTAGDDRVCPLCLPLSENFYAIDAPRPPIPRHPRCRCRFRPKTKSYRELGIDLDDMQDAAAPIVLRGQQDAKGRWVIPQVDVGGAAPVRSVRFYLGGLKEAFADLPKSAQRAMVGPNRLELLDSGKLALGDLVDPVTGRQRLLPELRRMAGQK